jgi:serine/threonine-protein kinase HipA
MALNLYGRANRLDRAHFLDAAARLGLRDRAAARMIDDVAEAAHGWIDRCAEIGFTPRQTELLADMLSARITSLQRPAL